MNLTHETHIYVRGRCNPLGILTKFSLIKLPTYATIYKLSNATWVRISLLGLRNLV